MRLFILPLLLAIATLSLGTACTTRGSVTPGPPRRRPRPPSPSAPRWSGSSG
jgi:hypothetical protein